tara:strand:+ start:322 stop:705 length:384 start_codon:yes stop_codon:yes gene_type:complete
MLLTNKDMFKLPNQKHKTTKGRFFNHKEEAAPGTPLYRKELSGGVKGEANNDGTIFIDVSVQEGSAEERQILSHEMKHLTDMKTGKLKYDDNWIKWNGEEYPRAEGKILYEGEWVPEGSKEFPWEKH